MTPQEEPPPPGPAEAELLSTAAIAAFRLNGRFLSAAEDLARPAGLTAARWQILGAVLNRPLPVSEIARTMGMARQSVQRTADLLVTEESAEYLPNPAHSRAKLLHPTEAGRAALRRIALRHRTLAERLAAELGAEELHRSVAVLQRLSAALAAVTDRPD